MGGLGESLYGKYARRTQGSGSLATLITVKEVVAQAKGRQKT